jgi:hypothetical protein
MAVDLSMYIYIYVCMYVCMYVYIHKNAQRRYLQGRIRWLQMPFRHIDTHIHTYLGACVGTHIMHACVQEERSGLERSLLQEKENRVHSEEARQHAEHMLDRSVCVAPLFRYI